MSEKKISSPFARQCFVTAAVCLSILGHGCYVGFPAILLPALLRPGAPLHITRTQGSWLTSVMAAALLVGSFITPAVMTRLGRRPALALVAPPALAGWFATALAEDFEVVFLGRVLGGVSFGMTLPLWGPLVGEYCSPARRGAFSTTLAVAQAAGIFLIHLAGAWLGWRRAALLAACLPFASLVLTLHLPESPSFLATRRRYPECREAFRWLRGNHEEAELEALIAARKHFDRQEKTNILQDVKKREFYKPVLVAMHCQGLSTVSGGMTLASYSTIILKLLIGESADVDFWMILLDAQRVILSAIAVYFIHRINRRTLLFSVTGLCVLCHVAVAAYLYGKEYGFVNTGAWLPIVLINVQMFTVAVGMMPLPRVITGEVIALQYRGTWSVIGSVVGSIFTFFTLKSFPALISGIGLQGTYLLYAGLMTYCAGVLWSLLPETRGKTLQQIEDEFRGTPLKAGEAGASLQEDVRKMSVVSSGSLVVSI